jgi:virulence-associated protein VagC
MMNINFFDDPQEKPRLPEDVRLTDMQVDIAPDGRRVAVDLVLTPFIQRPSLTLLVENCHGTKAASTTIIETLQHQFSIVLHLRDKVPSSPYQLEATVYYASLETGERQIVDQRQLTFVVPEVESG